MENSLMFAKRQPDSDKKDVGVASEEKRQRVVPSAALHGGASMNGECSQDSPSSTPHPALLGEDSMEGCSQNAPASTPNHTIVGSVSGAPSGHRVGEYIIAPEHPLAFPEGTHNGFSNIVPPMGRENPWPTSLVRAFKTYRTADDIYQRMLQNMSPRLLSSVLRIFRAIDGVFVTVDKGPTPPTEWRHQQTDSWQNSMRCGMQMVRMDKAAGIMTGVDVNPFWT
eukprot:3262787-Rhodomonas_salina.1